MGLDDKRGGVLILRRCGFDSKLKRVCVVADGRGKKIVYGKGAPEVMKKGFFESTPPDYERTSKLHMSGLRPIAWKGVGEDTVGVLVACQSLAVKKGDGEVQRRGRWRGRWASSRSGQTRSWS